jgi:hypothetical protein
MATPAKTDDTEIIFTKTIRLRNGKVLYAAAYGLQAFRIRVRRRRSR